MGQESSALAQRSVDTSAAGGTRVGSIQGSHNSSYVDDVTDKRQDELPSDRSRQQAHAAAIKFPLPRRQQTNTPDTRVRPRSPPSLASHASARFPSPGSARHRFVRENLDGRQMTDDRSSIHPRSSRSPIARFGSRNDLTHQQSPVPRRYSDNHASWAQNSGSPISPRERAGYPPEDANFDRTRDYHGLRNVPVGPRRSFTGTISVKKDHSTRSPCIFISLRYIPKLPNLKWHLNRLLKAHRPEEIIIDDFGWNLIFNDSPAGQETLRQCYEVYNKRMFFDEYELVMQCFPTGRMPRPQYHEDIKIVNTLDGSSESRLPSRRSSNAALPNPIDSQERKFPCIEPTKSHQSASVTGSLNLNDQSTPASSLSTGLSQNLLRHSSEGPRTHEATPNRFNTSLLPIPSDRDETGSLASIVTRSDGSRVKRNKCHRCKGEPVPGSSTLVRCSTCSREYHRRCHQDPSIPADLPDGHDWSCARCVKKGRTAKHLQTNDGNASSPKLCMPSVETESSLGRLPYNDEQNCSQGHVRPACDNSVLPVTGTPRSDSKSPQNEIDRSAAANTELKASIVDNDPVHSDADDLVARSFAAPVIQSRLNPRSQNPGKLKITRTKLPPPAPVSVVQHTGGASASAQPGSSVAASPETHAPSTQVKAAQGSEPVARNSVADLRALANERHQSAIKSGNRENSANEERDRHVTSINPYGFSGAPLPPQPQRRHDSISATPAMSTRETEKEIPESPEEVRRADQTGGKATRDPRLVVKQSSILQEPVESPSDAESMMNEQPPVLKGPRPPSNIVRCSICQKKIPPGPSGKNKLCSACKKDKAAATATGIGVANATTLSPWTNIMPAHSLGAPVARMIAGPTKAAELEAPVNGVGGNADLDSLKQAAPMASDNAVQGSATPVRQTENNTNCSQQILPQVRISGNHGTDMPSAECAHTDTRDRSRLPDHIPHFDQPASIDHTTPAQVTAFKNIPSNSRLDFIKSVVGNSFERPKGSRLTLVAMALGSVASRRMQAKDVMDWIADTVPGYKKGEGNWASRISAQLSQGRLTDSGGYWREDEWQEGDGGKPKGRWYQLLPEREDEMWTWCPTLGEPLSPSQRRHKSRVQTLTGPSALDLSQPGSASFPVSATKSDSVNIYCGSVLLEEHGKRLNDRLVEPAESDAMDVDKPPADDSMEIDVPPADDTLEIGGTTADDTTASVQVQKRKHRPSPKPTGQFTADKMQCFSEDDEPLSMQAKRRRRETPSLGSTGPRATPQQPLHVNVNDQSNVGPGSTTTEPTEGQRSTFDTTMNATNNASSTTNASRAIPHLETLYIQDLGKLTREISVQPSITSEDQVATSLYDEWPNFRQQASDEYDKLVEISKRPRKKKTFGKVSHAHSQLHEPFSGTAIVAYNPSPEKRSRFTMTTLAEPYPWENPNIDLNRKEYASLEDFFDFPDNMIPIISEGQLAYRDGTRTDDGRLPRAREIFRPG